jgi:hypothetical protein
MEQMTDKTILLNSEKCGDPQMKSGKDTFGYHECYCHTRLGDVIGCLHHFPGKIN